MTSEYGVYAITVATTNGWGRDYTATAAPVAGGGTSGVDQTQRHALRDLLDHLGRRANGDQHGLLVTLRSRLAAAVL